MRDLIHLTSPATATEELQALLAGANARLIQADLQIRDLTNEAHQVEHHASKQIAYLFEHRGNKPEEWGPQEVAWLRVLSDRAVLAVEKLERAIADRKLILEHRNRLNERSLETSAPDDSAVGSPS